MTHDTDTSTNTKAKETVNLHVHKQAKSSGIENSSKTKGVKMRVLQAHKHENYAHFFQTDTLLFRMEK